MADKSIAGSILDLAKLGLLAGAGFLIYKNWGGISSVASGVGTKLTGAVNSATNKVGKGLSDYGDLLNNKQMNPTTSDGEGESENPKPTQTLDPTPTPTPTTTTPAPVTTPTPTPTTTTPAPVQDVPTENLPTTPLTGNSIYDALPDISKSAYDIVSGVGRASGTKPLLQSTNALQIAGGLIGNGLGSLWDLLSGKK